MNHTVPAAVLVLASTGAAGYTHAHPGYDFIPQDPRTGDFIIEAENLQHTYTGETWDNWQVTTKEGASNEQVIRADPFWRRGDRELETLKELPRVGYNIEFHQGGLYQLAVDGYANSQSENTFFYRLLPYGDPIFGPEGTAGHFKAVHISPNSGLGRSDDVDAIPEGGGRYTLWIFRVERRVEIDQIDLDPVEPTRYSACSEEGYFLTNGAEYPWQQYGGAFWGCGAASTAPVMAEIGTHRTTPGGYLEVPLHGWDYEQDTLTFTADGLPDFVTLTQQGPGEALLTIAPATSDAGSYQINLMVSDGTGSNGPASRRTLTLLVDDEPPCDCSS